MLAAGTSNGHVAFYDIRGKPKPFVVLHAYGSSEVILPQLQCFCLDLHGLMHSLQVGYCLIFVSTDNMQSYGYELDSCKNLRCSHIWFFKFVEIKEISCSVTLLWQLLLYFMFLCV